MRVEDYKLVTKSEWETVLVAMLTLAAKVERLEDERNPAGQVLAEAAGK